MKVLLVEDDPHQAKFVCQGLQEAGHVTDVADNGKDGLFLAITEKYELIIIDRMLPQVDGLTIVRTLRASKIATPVLILSALGDVDDRVDGLRAGGDDYLVKPFAIAELMARMEALERRARPSQVEGDQTCLRVADLELDLIKRSVMRSGRHIDLKPKEFQLLEYLMRHAQQVVTRTMLLEAVWDYHFDPATNVIDVHISNLRAKLDESGASTLIHTIRGAGYRFGLAL
ncbi:MAG TPA: response regulator transcription factor, partial [Rhodocyclaceae bacterium]|nr:response regulator transcription factor [Rhodocyclaceae bacterium]